jgi:hypothetical protein
MPALVLMFEAGVLLVKLRGPISGTIFLSTRPLLIPAIDLVAR